MNTHALLDHHPSVQALTIGNNKVNPAKAAMHQRTINSRPFTTASAVIAAHKGGRKDAKGAHVEVVRNEANIKAAAVAAAAAARGGGGFKVTATTKLAEKRGLPSRTAPGGSAPLPPVNRPPSAAGSGASKTRHGSKSKAPAEDDDRVSLVSSAASSFNPTSSHAVSYSDYSCSCCHPRKAPSSVVSFSTGVADSKRSTAPSAFSSTSVPLSAYENMTSISERIAKQRSAAGGASKAAKPSSRSGVASSLTGSMTSTKLRALENELAAEREHRRHTEDELAEIKARQDVLLSRLSDKEREEVRRVAAQVRDESSRVSDKR